MVAGKKTKNAALWMEREKFIPKYYGKRQGKDFQG